MDKRKYFKGNGRKPAALIGNPTYALMCATGALKDKTLEELEKMKEEYFAMSESYRQKGLAIICEINARGGK